MRTRLILIAGLLLVNISYADVYKTVDKQGRTVYTDQPMPDDTKAKIVTLPTINQLPSVEPTVVMTNPDREAPEAINYNLEIITPESGTRLLADQRDLHISVSADNPLQEGHFFVYYMNGKSVRETTDPAITINEPPRGENKVYVEVMDNYGNSFGQSSSVIVYVMRPTVLRPNVKRPPL